MRYRIANTHARASMISRRIEKKTSEKMHVKPITVIDVFSLVFAGASSETVCTDSLLIFIRVSRAVFGVRLTL